MCLRQYSNKKKLNSLQNQDLTLFLVFLEEKTDPTVGQSALIPLLTRLIPEKETVRDDENKNPPLLNVVVTFPGLPDRAEEEEEGEAFAPF